MKTNLYHSCCLCDLRKWNVFFSCDNFRINMLFIIILFISYPLTYRFKKTLNYDTFVAQFVHLFVLSNNVLETVTISFIFLREGFKISKRSGWHCIKIDVHSPLNFNVAQTERLTHRSYFVLKVLKIGLPEITP